MSDTEKKQAATAEGAAEPVEKKKPAAKKPAKTDAAKTAAKVAVTAAKVAEAAAKVAEAAAMVAETAKEDSGEKKPAKKAAAKPAAEKAEKPAAAKKPAAEKAEKPAAEKKPAAAKKTVAEKAEKPAAEKKPAAAKKPAAEKVEKPAAEKKPAAAKKPAAEKPAKAAAAAEEVAATADAPKAKAPAKTAVKSAAEQKSAPAKKYAQDSRYRLYARYKEEIIPALVSERGYKNVNQAPKLDKIVLNMRLGDVKDNSKSVQTAINELAQIAGQKPVPCKAKKSVANFKLREGMVIGAKVTLRGLMAYEFLDKLISVALPRVRDFRGVSGKAFDGRGNYALGVKEQIIFPEISYELVEKLRGFDIAIITTANTDDEAKALLTKMGMPFRN